jgi:hypothetical protein
MTRRDPIVEEVRKHRAAIARKHGGDIGAILTALEQEPDDTPTVSLAPRLLGTCAEDVASDPTAQANGADGAQLTLARHGSFAAGGRLVAVSCRYERSRIGVG